MAIVGKPECVFQCKVVTHSTAKWSPIPFQSDQPFQSKVITDSIGKVVTFWVFTGTVRGV